VPTVDVGSEAVVVLALALYSDETNVIELRIWESLCVCRNRTNDRSRVTLSRFHRFLNVQPSSDDARWTARHVFIQGNRRRYIVATRAPVPRTPTSWRL